MTAAETSRQSVLDISKRNAFLLHLSVSALVVGAICAVIFYFWYPAPYFDAKGAGGVLRVLVGVDLILGPALTLILYKPRKPGLLLDLSVIAAIQLGALIYGTTVIFQERPYYAVFAVDRFEVIAYRDADASMIKHDALRTKPLRGPILAVASLPEDPAAFQRLLEETVFEGQPDIQYRPEYWDPYDVSSDVVARRARSLATLVEEKPETEVSISRFARSLERNVSDFSYVPLVGKDRSFVFVIDAVTAEPIDIIDADPWDNNTT
ncbi:MAG: TfpX/TfpZ family type IV pilin accessory protein [Gammaproteobacteria bacterium]